MTNQHPLTDSFLQSYYKYGDGPYDEDQMRDVADRQLEQVIEYLKSQEAFLGSLYYNKTTGVIAIDFESIECSLRQAMRPTQEDN